VSIALMTGVAGMLVAGVLHIDEAYAAINWKTVFVMACLIPLGWAMDSSGAAAWIAGHTIEQLPEGLPVVLLEAALAILTTLFSLVIGHVGATIVMVPMGINLALAAGGNPTAFALLVAMSASNNFMTASNPVMSMITGPAGTSRATCGAGCAVVAALHGGGDHRREHHVLRGRAAQGPPVPSTTTPSRTSTAICFSADPLHGPAMHSPAASSNVAPCTAHIRCPLLVAQELARRPVQATARVRTHVEPRAHGGAVAMEDQRLVVAVQPRLGLEEAAVLDLLHARQDLGRRSALWVGKRHGLTNSSHAPETPVGYSRPRYCRIVSRR
jgi:hypothetical protein